MEAGITAINERVKEESAALYRLRDEIGLIPPNITMANAPKRRAPLPMANEASA